MKAPLPPRLPTSMLGAMHLQGMTPAAAKTNEAIYNSGLFPASVGGSEVDADPIGGLTTYQPGGATTTASNAFFQSLGGNGRSCATCHEPPSGMSISVANIAARNKATHGTDPLFAPVDGANCPNQVAGNTFAVSHSLILKKGLIRIFIPVPTQTTDNPPQPVEFTISVLSDPTGCNTDPNYNSVTNAQTGVVTTIISLFRRPTLSTNLAFKTTTLATNGTIPAVDPVYGTPLPTDPNTGLPESGNILADGREPTLQSQASDATMSHSQLTHPPTPAQVAQMVAFETGLFSGQSTMTGGGLLKPMSITAGTLAGPVTLSALSKIPLDGSSLTGPAFTTFDSYAGVTKTDPADLLRQSIYRGQQIFNTRAFTVDNVAGFNGVGSTPNPATATCASCHNWPNAGTSLLPHAQFDTGIGGDQPSLNGPPLASDLPVFRITCNPGFQTFFNKTQIDTNDPGAALITGRCSDVGRFTVPQLRALAAHAPYFSDGSAATLTDAVNFYNSRFAIGLSATDIQDLVNFLNCL